MYSHRESKSQCIELTLDGPYILITNIFMSCYFFFHFLICFKKYVQPYFTSYIA